MTFGSGQHPHVTGFRYSSVAYSGKEVCFLKKQNKTQLHEGLKFDPLSPLSCVELFTRFSIVENEYVQACASFRILIALILGYS